MGAVGLGGVFFSSESVYSGAFDIHFGHGCPWVFVAGMDVGCLGVDWFWGEELLLFGLAAFMFWCNTLFVPFSLLFCQVL